MNELKQNVIKSKNWSGSKIILPVKYSYKK